ncbi:hypothetical protein EU537_12640 [Candidatus Thorarchaeota archaeon]|nr:MAG: hypothetical protein EU537_12640 [Candidatus Thorarchaeota archaeon]
MKLPKRIVFFSVLFLTIFIFAPEPAAAGGNNGDLESILPTHAIRYYNADGKLIGAAVQNPNEISNCEPVNAYNASEYLPSVRARRIPKGLEFQLITDDRIEKTKVITESRLSQMYGSIYDFDKWFEEEKLQTVATMNNEKAQNASIEWIFPTYWWEKEYTEVLDHQWTNIAELYSGKLLRNHLRLKMTSGTYTVTRLDFGPLSKGSEVTYAKTWVTDLYAQPWQTFTIEVMMDYTYEYWVQYVRFGGSPASVLSEKQIWWCSLLRGGTVELTYPYPDIDRAKTYSDDAVSLEPGESKEVIYNEFNYKSFEFDVGVHLKKKWFPNNLVELDVPIISYTSIEGHFTNYEAVYELTSTANYFHIWDMYEFGKNYGTTSGFVPTFEIYQ